jgi:hypothetical protein
MQRFFCGCQNPCRCCHMFHNVMKNNEVEAAVAIEEYPSPLRIMIIRKPPLGCDRRIVPQPISKIRSPGPETCGGHTKLRRGRDALLSALKRSISSFDNFEAYVIPAKGDTRRRTSLETCLYKIRQVFRKLTGIDKRNVAGLDQS